ASPPLPYTTLFRARARSRGAPQPLGNVESGLAYAAMLFAGDGVPRDPVAALPWARRAAEAGIAEGPGLVAGIERALEAASAERSVPIAEAPELESTEPAAGAQAEPDEQILATSMESGMEAAPTDQLAPVRQEPENFVLGEAPPNAPGEAIVVAEPTEAIGQTALGLDYYFGRSGR